MDIILIISSGGLLISLITACYYYLAHITNKPFALLKHIQSIEKEDKTNIIFLIDEFWDDKLDKDLSKYVIDTDDDEKFIETIHHIQTSKKEKSLSIIIYTRGGSIASSDMIVDILLNYEEPVNIYIPTFAYSAGTMIALCGDTLFMNQYSILGPVDPQISYSVDEKIDDDASSRCLMQLVEDKNIDEISDDIYLKAIESKFLHEDNIQNLQNIITKRNLNLSKKRKNTIIKEFGSGLHPHHKPFNINKIKSMHIPVMSPVPLKYNTLLTMYAAYKNKFY